MVLGEHEEMSGEAASRLQSKLPGRQRELLEAVSALGKPIVLVLINGRPLDISWAAEVACPRSSRLGTPAAEGGNAIADLLYGDATPGGKLPVTWPAVRQFPSTTRTTSRSSRRAQGLHLSLLGYSYIAALPVWLRSELHDVRLLESACEQVERRWARVSRCL